MPSKTPPKLRTYTPEQRIALATEIDRRYRAGEGSIQAIAERLGTTDSNYYNWRRVGLIQPEKPPVLPPKCGMRFYTEAEREQLRTRVECLRDEGQSLEVACKAVGIAESTYRKWRRATAPAPAMRPVEITALVPAMPAAPPVPGVPLSLVTPAGYRVEGLTIESAAALLKALQ